MRKTFTVVGATGVVGSVVADLLSGDGHEVRRVSRRDGISIDATGPLASAFVDADGAFVMIPFDMSASNLHEREIDMASNIVHALTLHPVRRVVLLSGTSAHLRHRAGSGAGAGIMEDLLDRTEIVERVYLRACFFMENHPNLGFIDQALTGVYATMFDPDIPTPMIAAKDVGQAAAAILTAERFAEPRVRELLGPRDYTMREATRILGRAIGVDNVRYRQLDYYEGQQRMIAAGASPSFAAAVAQTARSFNARDIWHREPRNSHNTTRTKLEMFASDVIKPALLQR